MAVINYRKELVSFDFFEGWFGNDNRAIPSIKFFIHVWQRANCMQDVIDSLEDAYELQKRKSYVLQVNPVTLKARAARWRRKGVALKKLSSTSTLEALKRFALQEAV